MNESITQYREVFLRYLAQNQQYGEPDGLYHPIKYILDLGGKRMRPLLVLMAADLYGAPLEDALPAAMAVEVFHNFSLVHDDIMDAAPLRRGKPTVHQKWDANTGILSGDAMLIMAYQYLEQYGGETFKPLTALFSKTALQVCEGQQFDMDFEGRDDVTLEEYLHMIAYKTAVLLGCALQMGALIGGAPEKEQLAIYNFGMSLGIAFQLQDDYLDVFGDPETFGKQVGGDIIENKKTFLYLQGLELATPAEAQELKDLYSVKPKEPTSKVNRVKQIFCDSGADLAIQQQISRYTDTAFEQLENLEGNQSAKQALRAFGAWLLQRNV
jgi:geranylgeranyl diphosphate synthase type II